MLARPCSPQQRLYCPARPGISITSWSSVASSSFTSCVFAPLATSESGTPIPSTNRLRLRPFFSPIRGVGAHAFGCKRRFVHRAVDTLPIPCNGFHQYVLIVVENQVYH